MPTAKTNKPDEAKTKPIRDWLSQNNARHLWTSTDVPGTSDIAISCHMIGPKLLLLWQRLDTGSWEVFIPATPINQVNATLAALNAYISPEPDFDMDGSHFVSGPNEDDADVKAIEAEFGHDGSGIDSNKPDEPWQPGGE